jgi:peptidoglycan hydrolase-like protein with peptidoglycan-binding domain
MTRLMYDNLNALLIPACQMAAWYPYDPRTSGPPKNATQVLTIDNSGLHPDCNILDVETGAATNADAADWLDRKSLASSDRIGTIYTSTGNYANVLSHIGDRPHSWWAAQWNGEPTVIAGSVAHQYQSSPPAVGGDLSIVYDPTWYPATPTPPEVDYMLPTIQEGSEGTPVKVLQWLIGGLKVDGVFGPNTETRVLAYQRSVGLSDDGVVGPLTWGKLLGN